MVVLFAKWVWRRHSRRRFGESMIRTFASIAISRILAHRSIVICWAICITCVSSACYAGTDAGPYELVVQTGHGSEITSLAFDPTGTWLVTAEAAGRAKLWSTHSRQLLRSFEVPVGTVASFDPGGQYVLVAGGVVEEQKIILFELSTGREIRHWGVGRGLIRAAALNPRGDLLATATDMVVSLWDPRDGTRVRTFSGLSDDVWSLGFSHDGTLLAGGDWQGNLLIWNVASRAIVHQFRNQSSATSLAFSPDDRWIVSVSQTYGLEMREVVTGRSQVLQIRGTDFEPQCVAFSPDGRFIAAGGLRSVGLWDTSSGALFKRIDLPDYGHTSWTKVIAFDPSGRFLAAGTDQHDVFLWDLAAGYQGGRLGTRSGGVDKTALSEDGTTAAFAFKEGPLIVWRYQVGGTPKTMESLIKAWPDALALSYDGTWFATGDAHSQIRIRNAGDGKEKYGFRFQYMTRNLAFDARGKWLAVAGTSVDGPEKGGVRVDNLPEERRAWSLRHGEASLVTFSHDGRRLASASSNTSVKLWDMQNGEAIRTYSPHEWFITGLAISPNDAYLAVSSFGGQIKVWDMNSSEQVASLNVGQRDNTITFSPDSRQLAVGGFGGTMVFEVPSGRRSRDLVGQEGTISSIAFKPDGKQLVTMSDDGSIAVWDTKLGNEIVRLVLLHGGSGRADWIAMDRDGFFDGTRAAWQAVPIRFRSEPLKLYEPEQFFNQFYQPGLLADILEAGLPMKEILRHRGDPRAALDLASYRGSKMPELRIVQPQTGGSTPGRKIEVTIEAKDMGNGLRDLRVFRNQSLVHFNHGDLKPDPQTKVFRLVVPVTLAVGENEISAYVFNEQGVRSKSAAIDVLGSDSLKRKGKAYILAIGVKGYANADYNLKYADSDAKVLAMTLKNALERVNDYREVVSVELLNEDATKANILAAIQRLGSNGSMSILPPNAPRALQDLKPTEPEDVVIVFFSGHGTAKGDRYYLIPHDLGYAGGRERIDGAGRLNIISHSVSDRDLEELFEGIDAGKIMIIIDACQSGQALEAEEKRRGPMNSRGLAQLAYEKGMYLLAAAQSYQAALEFKMLGHGLLTYTLIEQGLKSQRADTEPNDGLVTAEEWLDYAVRAVPTEIDAANETYVSRTGKGVDYGEVSTVTGQAPRAYYRRERIGETWVLSRR